MAIKKNKDNKVPTSSTKKGEAILSSSVGNYEKHPFFVKKTNEAKNLLQKVGLPKEFAKKA